MSDARWDRIKNLHDRAIDLPPAERRAFLEQECGDDTALLEEVLDLLAMDTDDDFLKPPPLYADAPSLVGQVLGHFEIGTRIGRGGMGVVYRARDLDLKRDVAIKVLFKEHHLERDMARFRREAESVAKISHLGIVPVFSVGETDATIYFVMELVEGHDLDTELRAQQAIHKGTPGGPTPLLPDYGTREYCTSITTGIAGIAEALQAAHDARVVHRDIKPSNLLIGRDGRMRLVDFGIARDESLGLNHTLTEAMGTTFYMSPEQARSLKNVIDHRTDVYSLGVVLYEALALERPFSGETNLEVVDRIIKADPKPLRKRNPDLPADLDTICAHAMAKELGHRYDGAAAMAKDLRLFAAGKPIESPPVGAVTRVMRRAIRRRDLWLPLAGAVVAASGLTLGAIALAEEDLRPRLSVDVGEPAEVFVRKQDLDGRFGDSVRIGTAPFEEIRVDPGYYRIVVVANDTRFGEFTRDLLDEGRNVAVTGQLKDSADASAGMVKIAGGNAVTPEPGYRTGEPDQEIAIPVEGFWLEPTELSNRDYRNYFEATPGAERPECWRDPYSTADDLRPVTGITFGAAQACAEFLGKRLPTRAEMIVAAGLAGDPSRSTWGEREPREFSNIGTLPADQIGAEETPAQYREFVREVNDRSTQDEIGGCLFLTGNVQEWTETMYRMRTDQIPRLNPNQRVFFGRSYRSFNRIILQAVATANIGYAGGLHMGFRCARSATP